MDFLKRCQWLKEHRNQSSFFVKHSRFLGLHVSCFIDACPPTVSLFSSLLNWICPDFQVKTETTADLNILHEQKSKSATEEHERHVEGNAQQMAGESTLISAVFV